MFTIAIYSCQPAAIRKSRMAERSTEVDSVLYYPPKEIKDPFLDSLKTDLNNPSKIETIIYPPEKVKPEFEQVDGFRVQVFAGSDSLNAKMVENNIYQIAKDSVYFLEENNLYKIQLGDFLYRNDADMLVLDLRKNNFPGAWVVQTTVNVFTDTLKNTAVIDTATLPQKVSYPFKIQVLVTSDEIKAKTISQQISDQFALEGFYEQAAQIFKVYAGHYQTRAAAEEKLNLIRSNGWPDAWIVSKEKE